MHCEDNTLKMPQLVEELFTLSIKSNQIKDFPKEARSVREGRAAAYSALAWFRQRRHTAGTQREDKMFPMKASVSPEPGAAHIVQQGRRRRREGVDRRDG